MVRSAPTAHRRRSESTVVAIPIALSANPDGKRGVKLFIYHQWDDNQMCKSGDWLVHNGDDVYTVDRETFEQTYIYIPSSAQVASKKRQSSGHAAP